MVNDLDGLKKAATEDNNMYCFMYILLESDFESHRGLVVADCIDRNGNTNNEYIITNK